MFKSISLQSLKTLLQRLSEDNNLEGPEKITSNWIRDQLIGKDGTMRKHPAKQYPELFSTSDPEVAVTYMWLMGLDEGKGLLSLAKDMDENLTIWLDVLFIDQLSTNIPLNLAKAQEVFGLSKHHWVFGTPELLERGWCLFELCLRANQEKDSLILGDLGNTVSPCTDYGNDMY